MSMKRAEVGLARPRAEDAERLGGRAGPHRHFGDLVFWEGG